MIQYKFLFKAQNREKNCTRPGLLLYCKEMPDCLLANQYIPLGIVNSAKTIVHGVFLHLDSKNILSGSIKAYK